MAPLRTVAIRSSPHRLRFHDELSRATSATDISATVPKPITFVPEKFVALVRSISVSIPSNASANVVVRPKFLKVTVAPLSCFIAEVVVTAAPSLWDAAEDVPTAGLAQPVRDDPLIPVYVIISSSILIVPAVERPATLASGIVVTLSFIPAVIVVAITVVSNPRVQPVSVFVLIPVYFIISVPITISPSFVVPASPPMPTPPQGPTPHPSAGSELCVPSPAVKPIKYFISIAVPPPVALPVAADGATNVYLLVESVASSVI